MRQVPRFLLIAAATSCLFVRPVPAAEGADLSPLTLPRDGRPAVPADSGTLLLNAVPVTDGRGAVIGPQDLLEIKVFQLDQFNQTLRVAGDGSISLPLLGRVQVAGLTREQAERTIAGLLEERYINDPQVTVFVKEYESRKVAVTGAVQKPGSYEMLGEKTVLEMIAVAGGITRDVAKHVVVIRRGDGSAPVRRIPLDLQELIYRGDPASNVVVQPGDIIYLPIEEIVKVYVNGAVRKPGAIEFKASEPITVLQAVTAAEGTTDRAAERRVQIVRRSEDGSRQVIAVDLKRVKQGRVEDVPLLRDDVVFVPEAFF
jgi:polysaccharide biosynthesis/export protein